MLIAIWLSQLWAIARTARNEVLMPLNNTPFPPELRTMSIVPRWSIVHVTQRDTVANHSYFVTVYAHMISRVIKWGGPNDYLMFSALLHDLDEVLTGDLVGPIKEYIIDEERMHEYVDHKIFERFGSLAHEHAYLEGQCKMRHAEEADTIIKAADRLDAVFFLIMESRRGNSTILPLIETAQNRLEAAWRELPTTKTQIDMTWQTVILPSLALHKAEGGRGL